MSFKLKIHLITYNHVEFISECLESIFSQVTDFEFKIIIGDDGSTDGTQKILIDYKNKFPEIVELNLNKVQDGPSWLPGRNNFLNILKKCSDAEYIAMIEGDDLWLDNNKLQKQIDFLEKNKGISGCFHNSINIDRKGKLINNEYFKLKKVEYNQNDCIKLLKSSYASCSLVFRSECIQDLPKWYTYWTSDYSLDLILTEKGNLTFLNETMSAYRIHSSGTWMGQGYHQNMEQMVYRFLILLHNPKFKKLYGEYFNNEIRLLSDSIVKNYKKHRAVRTLLRFYWRKFKYRYLIRL